MGIGWLNTQEISAGPDEHTRQLMEWGEFATEEEAAAFLDNQPSEDMRELMEWGGFNSLVEAEEFLAELEKVNLMKKHRP